VGGTTTRPRFDRVWEGSSEGRTQDARNKPDIVAPAGPISVPTGSTNGATSFGEFVGTSQAAPHVAGVAAQLIHFGKTQGHTTDHRVIKAVLLNSAMKDAAPDDKPGERRVVDKGGDLWRPEFRGTDSLDDEMGAGQVNALAAHWQYAPDEADSRLIQEYRGKIIGWDLAYIDPMGSLFYQLGDKDLKADSKVTATLVWDRQVTRAAGSGAGRFDFTAPDTVSNLNLELFDSDGAVVGIDALGRVSWSRSPIDSVEHFYFTVPEEDRYSVRVTNLSDVREQYAFAVWATPVPLPGAVWLLATAAAALAFSGRRGLRRV
jgi:hypothetical protein